MLPRTSCIPLIIALMKGKPLLLILAIVAIAALGYFVSGTLLAEREPIAANADTLALIHNTADAPADVPRPSQAEETAETAAVNTEADAPRLNLRLLEIPKTQRGEVLIAHTGYTLSYDKAHNVPRWVAWELESAETEGSVGRANDFGPDPQLDARHQVTTEDYKRSGYDRGHMIPAADMHWSYSAMSDCFYMSNMCPQVHELNAGDWEKLEKACRRWAKNEGSIYIACGPIYDKGGGQRSIGREVKVAVPDGFFKVVLSLKKGKEKAIGFIFRNNASRQPLKEVCCTVDEVEQATGLDFFPNLDDHIEQRLEATANLKSWH